MITMREAAALVGVSPATWIRMRDCGKTPKPIKLGARCVRWRLDELRMWVEAGCPDRSTWETIRGDE